MVDRRKSCLRSTHLHAKLVCMHVDGEIVAEFLTQPKHLGLMRHIARQVLCDKDTVDETVSATAASLFVSFDSKPREVDDLLAYVLTSTRRQSFKAYHQVKREEQMLVRGRGVEPEMVVSREPEPDALITAVLWDKDFLDGCWHALGKNLQLCLFLRYILDMTVLDVAARMNRPSGTVRSWITRGRRQLNECLNSKGYNGGDDD